jgi:hypothetical protein
MLHVDYCHFVFFSSIPINLLVHLPQLSLNIIRIQEKLLMTFVPFHMDFTHESLEDQVNVHHFLVEGGPGVAGT